MPDEAWFACMTGDCEHATQAECDRWLRTEMIELAKVNLELETELQATSEALGEGDFDSISKHAAALRADLAAARSLLRDATRERDDIRNRMGVLLIAIQHDSEWPRPRDFEDTFSAYRAEASALLSELFPGQRLAAVKAALSAAPIPAIREPHD
jgi:hypothetical protein